jgi:hypothetical protein
MLIAAAVLGCRGPDTDLEPRTHAGSSEGRTFDVEGVVRDSSGPVGPGVQVWAWADPARGATPSARAVTDEDGRFRLTGLSTGDWRLTSPPEIATDLPRIREIVVPAGAHDVVLELHGGFRRR